MRAEGVELVHTHSSVDAWLAGFAARSLGLPVVRSRHVSIPVQRRRNFVYNALNDRIIASGESIRQVLIAGGVQPEKIVAIPAGVDVERFLPSISGETIRRELGLQGPVVGTVGMFRRSKGHRLLLQAVPEVLKKVPEVMFLWVGDGIGREALAQDIAKAGLTAKIQMTGFREDVPQVLAAMDVFVLPSIASDGVPQAILQALAMRKPVIGTAVGGIPEVIQHQRTGWLVSPHDPQALAEAILHVLRHRAQAAAWAQAGGELVAGRYTLEQTIDRTAAVYAAVLAVHPRGRGERRAQGRHQGI
jgi:glycosyltransferase involved in cell wall biosynthesis